MIPNSILKYANQRFKDNFVDKYSMSATII